MSLSGTTVDLLTLSFLWLLSMHGLLMLLAPWTLNFAPEQAELVAFSLLKMGTTLYQEM